MTLLARVDRCGVVQLDAATGKSKPGTMPARLDPRTGYLHVEGVLARSGLLTYSDGVTSWTEYRSSDELKAWAPSFASTPYTAGHPAALVDAKTWTSVARGVVLGPIESFDDDGLTYLRGTILICDADVVAKVLRGDAIELSIGFLSRVTPHADGHAPDGTACNASQTNGVGNHVAGVDQGRAGPACRLMLDGATVPTSNPFPDLSQGHVMPAPTNPRKDVAEVTEVAIPAPDGTDYMAPSWLAAELAELRAKVAAPAAPPPPAVPDAAALPAAPPPPAMVPPKDEEETDDARAALLMRAGRLGMDASTVLALEVPALREAIDVKTREVIVSKAPGLVALAKAYRGDALAALADAADLGTWGAEQPEVIKTRAHAADPLDERIAKAIRLT